MKARYSYPLLFFVPSAMLAALAGVFVVAAGAGVLWIFVYGDEQWPAFASTALMALATAASATTLVALVALSYRFGKRQESNGGLSRAHVLLALSVSLALPLLALLHQWQVGNLDNSSVSPTSWSKPTPLPDAA